ncbi:hypothetical protein Ahy_B03g064931 [Arachis hypogaea]|uniref:Uncharacterized protein n=1 Tax=Arachis hypogaea TaxID=3818 RepID=A0A445A0J3_ARAHY|nr:hypothetical protein Ahy_B03g064931 [Arachis hypogaea]
MLMINDKDGRPNQLRRRDLSPQARGWLDFVRRSLNPTSNTSKVTLERVVLIYSIMRGENVNGAKSTKDSTKLAFLIIIQRPCDETGVEKIIDEVLVDQDKPITAKKIAKVVVVNPLQRARKHRAHVHEPQGPPYQEEEAEDQPHYLPLPPPPYPQFLEGFNWKQMQGDIHQMRGDIHHLREDINQLKEQQQQ